MKINGFVLQLGSRDLQLCTPHRLLSIQTALEVSFNKHFLIIQKYTLFLHLFNLTLENRTFLGTARSYSTQSATGPSLPLGGFSPILPSSSFVLFLLHFIYLSYAWEHLSLSPSLSSFLCVLDMVQGWMRDRGHLEWFDSFLSPYGYQGSNLGLGAWSKVSLPTEPPHCLLSIFAATFLKYSGLYGKCYILSISAIKWKQKWMIQEHLTKMSWHGNRNKQKAWHAFRSYKLSHINGLEWALKILYIHNSVLCIQILP